MHDYDRSRTATTRTAAKMDLHAAWRAIVDKHQSQENQELFRLLQKTTDYLHSVGMDLIIDKSYLGKYYHGSDGVRMEGSLTVREREENTTSSPDPRSAARWVEMALDVHGSARLVSEGPDFNRLGEKIKTWQIDITSY
jgi:hypothetical protein